MDKLTVMDLMQFVFWGFFGAVPMFCSYTLGMSEEKVSSEDEGMKAFFFFVTIGFQIAFGIACYVAGVKA